MRILVTGATGKVGQALIAAVFGSHDHAAIEIRALCHNRILAESARLRVVRGSIEDRDVCRTALAGVTLSATLALAQRVYVLNNGHIALEGNAGDLKAKPEILHRYLGV